MSDNRTLGNMVTRISRELRRDGLTTDIVDSIITAIEHYQEDKFYFNEEEATANMTVGQGVYALPAGTREVDDLIFFDSSSNKHTLTVKTWRELNSFEEKTNSMPEWYAIYRNQLFIRPLPDKPYEMRISYQPSLDEISASATFNTTNAWVTEAEPMIRAKAKAELFLHVLRNREQAVLMEAAATSQRRKLRGKTDKLLGTGTLKKTRF